jgi:hypothetical protein
MFTVYIHRIVSDNFSEGSDLWEDVNYQRTKATIPDSTPRGKTHVDDTNEVPDGRARRVCFAGWRGHDSLEISIVRQTRLKVQVVAIACLHCTSENSSRSTSDEQNSCLETRKIHIFDYNLSPVGREEAKCMVRRQGF